MPRFFRESRTALSSIRWPRNWAGRPSIGLPVPCRASIAFCAPAFLVFMLFTPAVAAAQYSAYVNIVEGSIRCRQGLLWPYQGPLLSYEAWLKDPRGNTVGTQDKSTYSWRLDGEYSVEPQTSGTYTCYSRFSADGFYLETKQDAKFINNCGDQRGEIIKEYHDYNVNLTPQCSDFASGGGTANFSWSELNGGFAQGNPHSPWGLVTGGLMGGLEQTRTNYNRGGIILTSGYRCPHGNSAVGGVANSLHVHGRAADMYSASHPWTEQEFNLLRDAAQLTGPAESLFWHSIPTTIITPRGKS